MPPPCVGGTSRGSSLGQSQKVNPGGVARQRGTSSDPQCQVSVTAKMSRLRSRIVCPMKANLFERDLAFQTAARRPDEDGTDDVGEGEDVDEADAAEVEDECGNDSGTNTGMEAANIGENADADVDSGSVVSSSGVGAIEEPEGHKRRRSVLGTHK